MVPPKHTDFCFDGFPYVITPVFSTPAYSTPASSAPSDADVQCDSLNSPDVIVGDAIS